MVQTHECEVANTFCYVCAKVPRSKARNIIGEKEINLYKKAYKVKKLKNLGKPFTPNIMCNTCRSNLVSHNNKNAQLRLKRPAIWCKPSDAKTCYCCDKSTKKRFEKIAAKELPEKFNGKRSLNVFAPRYKSLPDDSDGDAVEESDSDEE